MSELFARMQRNDRSALDELFAEHGGRFVALARALDESPPLDRLREIIWDASAVYGGSSPDLGFALVKIAEALSGAPSAGATPSLSAPLVANLAAGSSLGLNAPDEEEALRALLEDEEARRLADRVKSAVAAALSAWGGTHENFR